MDVVHRIAEFLVQILCRIIAAKLKIIVHCAWDHADMKLLGTLGFTISIKGQALFRSVSQPFLDRKAIALGLRNLLALFVEKHFIDEAFGFLAAQRLGVLSR